jgi:toxin ParE1/3/4
VSLEITRKPRVKSDLESLAGFIAQDRLEPAIRLLLVARESFDRLAQNPSIGVFWESPRRSLAGIRFYPMPDPYRNYLIFYRIEAESIDILAILQGSRNLESVLLESSDRDFEE